MATAIGIVTSESSDHQAAPSRPVWCQRVLAPVSTSKIIVMSDSSSTGQYLPDRCDVREF